MAMGESQREREINQNLFFIFVFHINIKDIIKSINYPNVAIKYNSQSGETYLIDNTIK